jgi:hypothetical protein
MKKYVLGLMVLLLTAAVVPATVLNSHKKLAVRKRKKGVLLTKRSTVLGRLLLLAIKKAPLKAGLFVLMPIAPYKERPHFTPSGLF